MECQRFVVGASDGTAVVGLNDGAAEGSAVGADVGACVGETDGEVDGVFVGEFVVGLVVGANVGVEVVGRSVGDLVAGERSVGLVEGGALVPFDTGPQSQRHLSSVLQSKVELPAVLKYPLAPSNEHPTR